MRKKENLTFRKDLNNKKLRKRKRRKEKGKAQVQVQVHKVQAQAQVLLQVHHHHQTLKLKEKEGTNKEDRKTTEEKVIKEEIDPNLKTEETGKRETTQDQALDMMTRKGIETRRSRKAVITEAEAESRSVIVDDS